MNELYGHEDPLAPGSGPSLQAVRNELKKNRGGMPVIFTCGCGASTITIEGRATVLSLSWRCDACGAGFDSPAIEKK